ncbi:subtilisin-like protease SBT2.4 [Magnolia sinica]|uniref:subtilisin-like protease SBT2.4 n=1 Tax=Magnolia sinica TaxID=86752 RepID=UPI00265B6079|nr:subtilisin-like protease SBT2.4 [Magnolia sinica]
MKMKPPILPLLLGITWACLAEDRVIYLVLMEGDPVAFHQGVRPLEHGKRCKAYAKRLVESHDKVLESNLEVGSFKKLYSYTHIVNGFAVHATPSQVNKLKSAQGVSLIEKDRGAKLMTTYTPRYLGLTGPTGMWTQEGGEENAGDGIVIGIIDTGIDPTHLSFAYDPLNPFQAGLPQFSGGVCEAGPHFPSTSCNGKIVSAKYFAAGAAASMPLNASKDFLSPFDAVGHGSHVASTAAGNSRVPVIVDDFMYGWASGMAPRARIAVYKPIYPDVGTLADVVSAIDQAVKDGVDIITLSIGPDEPPEDTLTFLNVFDIFLLFARRAGIFVVQAAGNKGPAASSIVSYSPWAMGVGSSTTDRSFTTELVLGDGRKISGIGLSGPTFGEGFLQFRLVLAKDAVIVNGSFPPSPPYIEECQNPEALDPRLVQGSVVICSFSEGFLNGTSTLSAIFDTAKALGFMGFVFIANPMYGDFIAHPIPFSLPGIMIPKIANVQVLLEYYNSQTYRDERGAAARFNGRASIKEGRVASFSEQAPIVSRFSSRGPDIIDNNLNLADVLKPDILAPGDLIWAAWSPTSVADPILSGYRFALLSGTSMATPHVAGIAALIKQSHPSWTPSMIASAISTTASTFDNRGEPIMAEGSNLTQLYPSTPHDHGAGLINPSRALDPGLVFSSGFEDYISFLCSLPNMDPATVRTTTGKTCDFPIPNQPADLNLPSITISALTGSQTTKRAVTNVASKPETYLCSILQPGGVEVTVNPPWFIIAPAETQDLEIKLNVTQAADGFSFGKIVLTGSLDHIVRIPLSVFPISVAN